MRDHSRSMSSPRLFCAHQCHGCLDTGEPYVIKKAICVHEEDAGIIWKHTELRTMHPEVRRGRKLVISFIATVGQYRPLPPHVPSVSYASPVRSLTSLSKHRALISDSILISDSFDSHETTDERLDACDYKETSAERLDSCDCHEALSPWLIRCPAPARQMLEALL